MAEFDLQLAALELTTLFYLVVQVVLALVVGGLAYYCGRRQRPTRAQIGLVLSLVLAVVAFGLTLKASRDSWQHIESRRDDPLNYARVEDDLGFVRWSALTGAAVLVVTAAGSLALYRLALRNTARTG
ncbi:MAG TPA: hypothetical protein VM533_05645 [Fimbriiglobus sp.]|nr:hypothetical protein [Fimbriiglobus sp.]